MEHENRKSGIGAVEIILILVVLIGLVIIFRQENERAVLTSGNVFRNQKPQIALTFDDGPSELCTEKLLDGLKKRQVHVTFFLLGEQASKNRKLVKRIWDEGHLIGNHTYHHIEMTKVSLARAKGEIQKTNQLLEGITGESPSFMRPPYGAWEKSMEKEFSQVPVFWDVDSLDWETPDAARVARRVEKQVQEGDIILMHDCYDTSVQAALRIIDDLTKKGYEFVTVEQLMVE